VKLGFAGAGNMAAAMARGWARSGAGPQMLFCDLDSERAQTLADEVGGETREDLASLVADSDALLLAVKPDALDAVATELGGQAPPILSVMAATALERINAAFPGVPALRVMPNQPVEVGRGVLVHAAPQEGADALLDLLPVLGTTFELPEETIEAAMAVMSCSPAYVALFAEALAEAGAQDGLEPALSLELVAGTLEGTAELLRERDPEAIRKAVAPPGGATEAGLNALDAGGFPGAIAGAVEASLARFR
jgi:pyrroline-5-carboxylate reductase